MDRRKRLEAMMDKYRMLAERAYKKGDMTTFKKMELAADRAESELRKEPTNE